MAAANPGGQRLIIRTWWAMATDADLAKVPAAILVDRLVRGFCNSDRDVQERAAAAFARFGTLVSNSSGQVPR